MGDHCILRLSTITNHKFWNQNCLLLSVESKGSFSFFHFFNIYFITKVFTGGSVIKYPSANAGNVGLIPGLRRSLGVGNGNPLQYSCLGNSIDRVAWQATVHGDHKRVRHDLATKQLYYKTSNEYIPWYTFLFKIIIVVAILIFCCFCFYNFL